MSALEEHNVNVVGDGPNWIILGHGFGTDQRAWRHLVPSLLPNYKVVLYDLAGAISDRTTNFDFARYSDCHAYADDLLDIMDELNINSCTYVGHSVSGMLGVLASVERPHAFKKIVCLSASPRYINDAQYYGGFERSDLESVFENMRSNYNQWCSGFAPQIVGASGSKEAVEEFSSGLFRMRPDIALSVLRMIFMSDLRHILPQGRGGERGRVVPQVTVPCHFLQATDDLAVPGAVTEYLVRQVRASVMEFLPCAGHLPHISSPAVVTEAIVRHLNTPP